MTIAEATMERGLATNALDSHRIFRQTLRAMSRPGLLVDVPELLGVPAPLNSATAAIACSLFDESTPAWLDPVFANDHVAEFLRFQSGCPLATQPDAATFALVSCATVRLDPFSTGTDEFPESSTTLIVPVQALSMGDALVLSGPGIDGTARLADPGLPAAFWKEWEELSAIYPRGIDLMLTAGRRLCCLPRTVQVTVQISAAAAE